MHTFYNLRVSLSEISVSLKDFFAACDAAGVPRSGARKALSGHAVGPEQAIRITRALESFGLAVTLQRQNAQDVGRKA